MFARAWNRKIKDGESILGQIVHMECDKNKFAPPFKRVDRKLFFGKGITRKVEIVDMAIQAGLIQQSGSYFTFNGKTVRGTSALYDLPAEDLTWLRDNM